MKLKLLLFAFAFSFTAFGQEGFSVVVQKDNPAASITKPQLRRMIMGEGPWPDGTKAVVVLGPAGDAARAAALKQICGMSEADFAKHTLQVKFEGAGKPLPKAAASLAAVRGLVQSSAGALGIVSGTDAGDGLKILPVE